jgi:hypothetical protein
MKRYPKIRRIVRVEISPDEFVRCVNTVDSAMRRMGTHDPRQRLEMIGEFFGDEENGMAFTVRMECMIEMHRTPKAAGFSLRDPTTGQTVSSVAIFRAAAVAPLHFDDENQFFDEDEFFEIAARERQTLIAST